MQKSDHRIGKRVIDGQLRGQKVVLLLVVTVLEVDSDPPYFEQNLVNLFFLQEIRDV